MNIHALAGIRSHKHHGWPLTHQYVTLSFAKVERETVDVRTSGVAFETQLKVADGRHRVVLPNLRSLVLFPVLVRKRPRPRWEYIIKIRSREIECEGVNWI
jgi:hypothetical protein